MLRALVVSSAAVLAVGAAGCGSSSSPDAAGGATSTAGGGAAAGPGRFASDPKVTACLKKQGVTLPQGRRGGPPGGGPGGPGGPPGGAPPTGTAPNGAPPAGTPPNGARRPGGGRGFGGAQGAKLRKALQACGVTLPARPAQPGGTQTQTTPGSST